MTVTAWCSRTDVTAPHPDGPEFAPDLIDDAIAWSSDVLYGLTGERWPGPQVVEGARPLSDPHRGCWVGAWVPDGLGGSHPSSRMHPPLCEEWIRQQELEGRPIVSIEQVKIDGEIIDSTRYRLDDSRWLTAVRPTLEDHLLWWPACQRLDLPDTEVGTWSVDYTWGASRPGAGKRASATLAWELLVSWMPDSDDRPDCRLAATWTANTRAGTSQSRPAVKDLVASGLSGLPEVDLWLGSLRFGQQQRPAAVRRAGRPSAVRRPGSS